jgi:hypothetical protein
MISLTQMQYGSRVPRHGSSRRLRPYQLSSAMWMLRHSSGAGATKAVAAPAEEVFLPAGALARATLSGASLV